MKIGEHYYENRYCSKIDYIVNSELFRLRS